MKTLVAAGYGTALLPMEYEGSPTHAQGMQLVPLEPPLMRPLGIAHRPLAMLDGAAVRVLQTLAQFQHGDDAG